jgi:hypothetical protein
MSGQRMLHASLALAERHAVEANTKAEGFRHGIAKAKAKAKAARLELAKFKAPRFLSPVQQEHIRSKLVETFWGKFA